MNCQPYIQFIKTPLIENKDSSFEIIEELLLVKLCPYHLYIVFLFPLCNHKYIMVWLIVYLIELNHFNFFLKKFCQINFLGREIQKTAYLLK